jgi:hypothetical protein
MALYARKMDLRLLLVHQRFVLQCNIKFNLQYFAIDARLDNPQQQYNIVIVQ